MIPASQEVRLGDPFTNLINGPSVVAGEQLAEQYYISECTNQSGETNVGDYFTFHATTQYENAGGNENTMGLLQIEFDVCAELEGVEGYPKSRIAKIELEYTASP